MLAQLLVFIYDYAGLCGRISEEISCLVCFVFSPPIGAYFIENENTENDL